MFRQSNVPLIIYSWKRKIDRVLSHQSFTYSSGYLLRPGFRRKTRIFPVLQEMLNVVHKKLIRPRIREYNPEFFTLNPANTHLSHQLQNPQSPRPPRHPDRCRCRCPWIDARLRHPNRRRCPPLPASSLTSVCSAWRFASWLPAPWIRRWIPEFHGGPRTRSRRCLATWTWTFCRACCCNSGFGFNDETRSTARKVSRKENGKRAEKRSERGHASHITELLML